MSEKLIVFMDDARLVTGLSETTDVLIIALDSQAASELAASERGAGRQVRIKDASEYAEKRFASYDDLYSHFKAEVRERLRPKDSLQQSRFLFETFWNDTLQNVIEFHYIETLVREILKKEQPTRVEFAVSNRELNALFRRIVQHLS
jgi:hypothetical protein